MKKKKKTPWIWGLGLAIVVGFVYHQAESVFLKRRVEAAITAQGIQDSLLAIYPELRQEFRREFESAAQQNPTYQAYKEKNGSLYDLPPAPYSGSDNSSLAVGGGVIDGPVIFTRSVALDMPDPHSNFSVPLRNNDVPKGHLEIHLKADWRFFPGPLRFTIYKSDATPDTQHFLDLLLEELSRRNLHPEVSQEIKSELFH